MFHSIWNCLENRTYLNLVCSKLEFNYLWILMVLNHWILWQWFKNRQNSASTVEHHSRNHFLFWHCRIHGGGGGPEHPPGFFSTKAKFTSKKLVLDKCQICLKMLEMAILETKILKKFCGRMPPDPLEGSYLQHSCPPPVSKSWICPYLVLVIAAITNLNGLICLLQYWRKTFFNRNCFSVWHRSTGTQKSHHAALYC